MTRVGLQEAEVSVPPITLTVFERITSISFRIFRAPAMAIARSLPRLKEDLLKSDISVTPDGLVSFALLTTTLSAIAIVGIVIWALLNSLSFLALMLPVPLLVFALVLNTPKFSQSSRASRLENELGFLVGYFSILAGGGMSLLSILRRIASFKIFPAASREANRILVDVDVYGKDPITALEKAAKYNPNRWFSDLLLGYTTILKTGGDHVNYLNIKLNQVFEERAASNKRSSETTDLIAETYLIVTVVLGITVYSLYLVQTLISNTSAGLTNVFFFSFIIVPITSSVFIWILDGVQAKWPYTDTRPYKQFLASLPVGIAIFFIPLPIKLYLHLSIALLAMTIVPAFFATLYSRQRRGIEQMLPDFIRDVSEGRKIGLPPEGSIERLHGRSYGPLTKSVEKMASQLTWGLSVKKVISSFTSKAYSWIAMVVVTLMLEVIEVGGGSVRGFSEMADFTRKTNMIESERRASLRGYIFVAYIAAVMVVTTTFVFIFFFFQPSLSHLVGLGTQLTLSPEVVDLLLTASIFEAWVIGIVAGKMGASSVAEGFKHAAIMVVISLATVAIGAVLFPVPL